MLTKAVTVESYRILETSTVRSQDMRRFTVTKLDGRKAAPTGYVVTYQSRHQFGCSCPAGRNLKHCKHVNMCLAHFN